MLLLQEISYSEHQIFLLTLRLIKQKYIGKNCKLVVDTDKLDHVFFQCQKTSESTSSSSTTWPPK